MKNAWVILLGALFLMTAAATRTAGGDVQEKHPRTGTADMKAQKRKAQAYPIAPGIWYPGDGPLPDKPIRYYRVRCWPGCHSGSRHGMYPKETLDYDPIFPTSTVDRCLSGHKRN
jgi:hypothetical protein